MFPMVEMSRLTVAAPLDAMDDVLAAWRLPSDACTSNLTSNSRMASAWVKPPRKKAVANC
ncbi:MAG: hypothetical protein CM15mP128_0930 [Methanobacteriota archaeon]|nr:MAG: hypothetical protein CM15mP128_0930 [Euryarchaeota archaeon]